MNLSIASLAVVLALLPQEVYSPADFVRVAGSSLKARYDNAVAEGRRGATDTFWVGYQLPVRDGLRMNGRDGDINVYRNPYSDGIEWTDNAANAERVGLLLLLRKSDGSVEKTRLLNLNQNFRVHDRKVYWLGDLARANAEESLALLTTLVGTAPRQSSSSLLMTMSLHPSPSAGESLLRIARTTTSTEVKKNAVFWLGQEVSRQAGEELEKMAAADPDVEVQKQAVFAISQRNNDESIPSLLRIAKEHPNSAVRKQAVFWLGQKRDPRVLDLFEQMLKK